MNAVRSGIVAVFVFLACGGLAAAQPAAPQRASVPDGPAQEAARTAAAEIYSGKLQQAKTIADKTALAVGMIDASSKFQDGSADQYVLLTIARDVAAGAGDLPTAIKATSELAKRFDVSAAKLKAESLLSAASRATAAQYKDVAELALTIAAELAGCGEYGPAIDACEAGRQSALRARQTNLAKDLTKKVDELRDQQKAAEAYQRTQDVLKDSPVEPAANLAAGRHLCFVKGDWERGIPYLALGSDAKIKAAAVLDLRGATSAEDQVAIGDAWWDLAEAKQGRERDMLRVRAGYWYRQAEANIPAGLGRLKVSQRLAEIKELGNIPAQAPSRSPAEPRRLSDLFGKGAKWVGKARHTKGPSAGVGGVDVGLQVTERDGDSFTGVWWNRHTTPKGVTEGTTEIKGTIDGNQVTWTGKQTSKAVFRDNTLFVEWEVPPYYGEATLSPAGSETKEAGPVKDEMSQERLDEVDKLPGAVIAVTGQVPTPIGNDPKAPRQLWGGTKFVWASEPKSVDVRLGVLEFAVGKTGVVYLVPDWEYQGGNDGKWDAERLSREQLQQQGWQYFGPWPGNEKLSAFRKLCKAGESYRIRTNKYWPPAVLTPSPR